MKSGSAELEKIIDEILDNLDSLEIKKDPLSKSFDDFLRYEHKRVVDGNIRDVGAEELINRLKEFKRSEIKYERNMQQRVQEWGNTAENNFSMLLEEEIGMAKEDIGIIRKPFRALLINTEVLHDYNEIFSEILGRHGIDFRFLMRYKEEDLSINKFFKRLRNNRCIELSALYNSSIGVFIDLMEMQLEVASDEMINKKYLEEVFIPLKKKEEGFVNEEELRQNFDNLIKLNENLCSINISTGKRFLARNILDIDSIYSTIRKKYSSLSEYIEKDLGLGAKPFF